MEETKKRRINVTTINLISSIVLQVLTVISGFVFPRLMLSYFGSETNGIVTSITKFLSYISLLEGGITGVVMANLYKPLCDKDMDRVSSIVKTTNKFYKKVAIVFAIYAIGLALVYPLIFHTKFSYEFVFWLVILTSINSFTQYCFSLTNRTLLNADKKVYFVSIVQSIVLVITMILSVLVIRWFKDILLSKIVTSVIFMIQPIVFGIYVKKHYKIKKDVPEDKELLKSRWDGFSMLIADFIHTNTDVVLLSFFTDMQTVSIYSIYALVCSGIRTFVSSVSRGIAPSIGQLYAKGDKEALKKSFNAYEYAIFMIVFVFLPIAALLICPFVMTYTETNKDANYYQPVFGFILLLAEGCYLVKYAHMDLAYSANKFKELKKYRYIEAATNIIISILLINSFRLKGVAVGTFVAMLYTMIIQVNFTCKHILDRKPTSFYLNMIRFCLFSLVGLLICYFLIPAAEFNYLSLITHGIIYSVIFGILYVILSAIFYREEIKFLFGSFRKKHN